jgi:uncharacterized protein
MTATARLLSGNRLHLNHGPIDLIIGADGPRENVERAYRAAWAAFPAILPTLVLQLPILRTPVGGGHPGPRESDGPPPTLMLPVHGAGRGEGIDSVAARMHAAVWPYRCRFITPMAAVAGSVADHVLQVMRASATLSRAYVNNGGDIAIYLAPGSAFTAGVVGDISAPELNATVTLVAGDGIGGIATSGWRGRSQSLGIADSVTILAATAATADAAATMIANAVDADDPAIQRRPACDVKDDSDLGRLPVTVGVGQLPATIRCAALDAGCATAKKILQQGWIIAAYIQLQHEMRVVCACALAKHAA